jgi:hypothetical protein
MKRVSITDGMIFNKKRKTKDSTTTLLTIIQNNKASLSYLSSAEPLQQ